MRFIILLFMLATQMDAACIHPEGIVSEADGAEIDYLITMMRKNKISTLEVKCIRNPSGGRHPTFYGGVYEVKDFAFWSTFATALERGRNGRAFSQRALVSHLLRLCEAHPHILSDSRGAESLNITVLPDYFPKTDAIKWRVGYTDWALEHKVHGSVTLCPHSGDIALHFVPSEVTDNAAQANEKQMIGHLRTTMDALAKQVSSLTIAVNALTEQMKLAQREK